MRILSSSPSLHHHHKTKQQLLLLLFVLGIYKHVLVLLLFCTKYEVPGSLYLTLGAAVCWVYSFYFMSFVIKYADNIHLSTHVSPAVVNSCVWDMIQRDTQHTAHAEENQATFDIIVVAKAVAHMCEISYRVNATRAGGFWRRSKRHWQAPNG